MRVELTSGESLQVMAPGALTDFLCSVSDLATLNSYGLDQAAFEAQFSYGFNLCVNSFDCQTVTGFETLDWLSFVSTYSNVDSKINQF